MCSPRRGFLSRWHILWLVCSCYHHYSSFWCSRLKHSTNFSAFIRQYSIGQRWIVILFKSLVNIPTRDACHFGQRCSSILSSDPSRVGAQVRIPKHLWEFL